MCTSMSRTRLLAMAVVAMAPWASVPGASVAGAGERGKGAVVLAEIAREGRVWYASAFCIDPSGLFVTSARVVRSGLEGGVVKLVPAPGGPGAEGLKAKVVRWNDALDLAVLKVDAGRPLPALELGGDDMVRETLPVTAYGSPLTDGLPEGSPVPQVSEKAVRVTAMRRTGGKLAAVQLDGQFTPGYYGSPLVDADGRVLGVVQSGLFGARINVAVPVGRLSEYLASPLVVFEPPPLEAADRTRGVDWTILVKSPDGAPALPADLGIAALLPGAGDRPRRSAGHAAGAGVYTVKVVPLQGAPDRLVTLAIETAAGSLVGVTQDLTLRINGKAVALGDLQSLHTGRPPRASLRDGTQLRGPVLGLGRVELLTAAGPGTIDLRNVRAVEVLKVGEAPRIAAVDVEVEVRKGTTVLCTETRRVEVRRGDGGAIARTEPVPSGAGFNNDPRLLEAWFAADRVEIAGELHAPTAGLGKVAAIRPPAVEMPEAPVRSGQANEAPAVTPPTGPGHGAAGPRPPLVRTLPGKVTDVTPAGAGRFLLLTLRESHSLAVFDANVADVVKTLPLLADDVLVAGGGETFVLVYPGKEVIERWSLASLAREESRTTPVRGKVRAIAMGSDSAGPILIHWTIAQGGVPSLPRSRFGFIDPIGLKLLKVGNLVNTTTGDKDVLSPGCGVLALVGPDDVDGALASDDGRLFVMRDRNYVHTRTIELTGTTVKTRWFGRFPNSLPTVPAPDGRLLYAQAGVIDTEGNQVLAPWYNRDFSITYLPCADTRYYLGITAPHWVAQNPGVQGPAAYPLSLTLFAAGSQSPLLTVDRLVEMDTLFPIPGDSEGLGVALRRCVHWVPSAELLVTIPKENDRLVLRRLSDSRAAAKRSSGYIHVTSPRSLLVPTGKKLSHRIEVQSGQGKLRFTLNRGPEGLTLSPDGLVEWAVPARGSAFTETAVITIEDESGNSLFHRLDINVH
jgi:S1-C subfamily serine protease